VLAAYPALAILLHAGTLGTGLLFAARGAGVLLGPFLLGRVLRHGSWLMPGLAVSMTVYGVAYVGLSVVSWLPLALLIIVVAHIAGGGNWAMSNLALQREVPDALRGRVFSADLMVAGLAISASQVTIGGLVDHASPRLLLACCGGVTLLYGIGWRWWAMRLAEPSVLSRLPPQTAD
jgi:MFS family permease